MSKKERQQQLLSIIEGNPFVTDRELTRQLKVSIQTIRLDRMELGIPVGDIVDLQLDKSGISIFEIREEHVFSRNGIARGHYVFGQANSLAVAIINDEIALTASADIRFVRMVRLGEKCIAKAQVISLAGRNGKAEVNVFTYVGEELVFQGHFIVYRSAIEEYSEGGNRSADRH
jgi:acyl-coenzyme A thioesterase PaaI-like protein